MKIVIPDKIDFPQEFEIILAKYQDIDIYPDLLNDVRTISTRIKDAEIITANYIDISQDVIERSPRLKYIISPAVGYDWIDINAATKKGIRVLNCPTFTSQAVAEHAIALIFAVYRKIVEANISIKNDKWLPTQFLGREVCGKKLGLVGHGRIGKKLEKMAKALGMKVSCVDSKSSANDLDQLIINSDIIVLALPLKEDTLGLINKRRLNLMNKDSILINISRGLIIDEEYLLEKLKKKEISGAGLDVFTRDEIIREPNENIKKFASLPNVVCTPHIGYLTQESIYRLGEELIRNINSCLAGNPINVVN